LVRMLSSEKQPIQILFAGKAHPHDEGGKQLIREIVHFAQQNNVDHRLVFLEDYDINLARYLVQGVDVWVNTPRRPLEASGTSGMKVVANGGLNLSIQDGWWDEAYNAAVGWAIGYGEEYQDIELQDKIESDELYDILEREIIPAFYQRSSDMLPREWIRMMKASIRQLCPIFNTDRMVQEYAGNFYVPARTQYEQLKANNYERGTALAHWRDRLKAKWNQITIKTIEANGHQKWFVGENLPVTVTVQLGELSCDDVSVELYVGQINPEYQIDNGTALPMTSTGKGENGEAVYKGEIPCSMSGRHGFAVRVLPRHEDLTDPYSLKLICWK